MQSTTILNSKNFDLTVKRLCYQLIENHNDFKDSVIIGLQPRGIYLAQRIHHQLTKVIKVPDFPLGNLDVTFFRDDFRKKGNPMLASSTEIDFIIEDKRVILVDDVLFTGRTIRAGLDAMLAFGRPKKVELLVLVERRFSRDLPIKANYIGKSVDSITSQRVKVEWKETEGEDVVYLHSVKV